MQIPKLYAERDVESLGEFYAKHVGAMTREELHEKCDIAAELAWRDSEIAKLLKVRAALAELVGADSKAELEGMDVAVRIAPGCDRDKAAALNAIHALLDTLPQ